MKSNQKTFKKYIGSSITIFAAIFAPLFAIFPIFAGIFILRSEISTATIFLSLLLFICSVVWSVYLTKILNHLYTWATFDDNSIHIKSWFRSETIIEYSKCTDVGIGGYVHGFTNPDVGFTQYFIYFSYSKINDKNKANMNKLLPSNTFCKVSYNKKLYDYLIDVLPSKQSLLLKQDYLTFFQQQQKRNRN